MFSSATGVLRERQEFLSSYVAKLDMRLCVDELCEFFDLPEKQPSTTSLVSDSSTPKHSNKYNMDSKTKQKQKKQNASGALSATDDEPITRAQFRTCVENSKGGDRLGLGLIKSTAADPNDTLTSLM